jgi:hypothetical protein
VLGVRGALRVARSVVPRVFARARVAATELKADKISIAGVAPSFIITAAVVGYSALYLDQAQILNEKNILCSAFT